MAPLEGHDLQVVAVAAASGLGRRRHPGGVPADDDQPLRHGSILSRGRSAAGLPGDVLRPRRRAGRCGRTPRAAGPRRCRAGAARPAGRSPRSRSPCRSSAGRIRSTSRSSSSQAGRSSPSVRSTASPSRPSWAARQCAATSRWWSVLQRRPAGRDVRHGGGHQRPDQRGDQHRVVHRRADVADPDLHRRVLRRQPGVPVEHPLVEHHPAGDQLADQPLVVLVRLQERRRRHRRPALPLHRAPARVAGVLARGERRVGGRPRAASAATAVRG